MEDQGPKPSWRVGGSAFYTTGKYGTDVRTDTLYVPTRLRRVFDNGDLTLVIPYVTVTSNCGVTIVNGVPLRTGGLCPSTTSSSGTFPKRVTESGLGDLLLERLRLVGAVGLLVEHTVTRKRREHFALAAHSVTGATTAQQHHLAAAVHLCGAGAGAHYVRQGFRFSDTQRCGDQDPRAYLRRVDAMQAEFARLAAAEGEGGGAPDSY